MKKWKCTVCGYIHTGEEPPEKCPVCGADSSRFVLLESQEPAAAPTRDTSAPDDENSRQAVAQTKAAAVPAGRMERLYQQVAPLLTRLHAHPVSVHIPNGVLPVALAFLFGGALFNCPSLVSAGFYNLIVVLLAMPVVLATGANDWKLRYGGHFTSLFVTKMACGAVVSVGCLAMVLWLLARPELIVTASISRRVFFFFGLITLAAAVIAGYCGGKLVFVPKDSQD